MPGGPNPQDREETSGLSHLFFEVVEVEAVDGVGGGGADAEAAVDHVLDELLAEIGRAHV